MKANFNPIAIPPISNLMVRSKCRMKSSGKGASVVDSFRTRVMRIPGQTAETPQRRKVSRHSSRIAATIETSAGRIAAVTLADVSTHGCSIRGELTWLRCGSFIAITLESDHTVQSIVRWTRDGGAGIEFLRPLTQDHAAWQSIISDVDSW